MDKNRLLPTLWGENGERGRMTIFGRELTLEQVIGFVECNASPDEDLVHRAALELIAALRESFGTQPANVPLTLDELRGMDGEPVYIVGRIYSGWTVPWRNAAKYIARCPDEANISYYPKDYGKTWLAYRRKLEGSENNANL